MLGIIPTVINLDEDIGGDRKPKVEGSRKRKAAKAERATSSKKHKLAEGRTSQVISPDPQANEPEDEPEIIDLT